MSARRDGRSAVLRAIALVGAALLVSSFLAVLYHVVDVVGNPTRFLVVVALTLLAASVLARYLSLRLAITFAVALFTIGMVWYLLEVGGLTLWLWPRVVYTLSLLAGRSVLEIVGLETWVVGITPAPVFLSWYLAVRRRYVASATIGGATTLFFVLTGDAGPAVALLGVVGAMILVGAGELDRFDGHLVDAETVVATVALAILVPALITVVPAGDVLAFAPNVGGPGSGEGSGSGTVESSLIGVDDSLNVGGSLELSAELRFVVESNREQYWRVGAYDLYTGDRWVRRGSADTTRYYLQGSPPGRTVTVRQRYRAKSTTQAVPAVWRPTEVSGWASEHTRVTRMGGLVPETSLPDNESYTVVSKVPNPTYAQLQNAGREYPETIRDRYLQLPDSTPARVARRTDRLTANADTPYETARTIERWLERNRAYSLNVSEPQGSIADAFLFEMQRGYCTYYATTMVVMLRTQDIPARFVVGYTPGQQLDEDEWAVRAQNAHAWVEVYFPDVGWVRFDPTPAGPRAATENSNLETARANNASNVDIARTLTSEDTVTPTETETGLPPGASHHAGLWYGSDSNVTISPGANVTTTTPANASSTSGSSNGLSFRLPSAQTGALSLLAVVGLAGLARRTGLTTRAYRAVWLRYQPRVDPETDVERAFERLSHLLATRHRERRPGETVRAYLDAVDADDRARRIAQIRERARYDGNVEPAAAEEAVDLVGELLQKRD